MSAQQEIAAALSAAIGVAVRDQACAVGGGSINQAYRFETENGAIFVKAGAPADIDMFAAEAAGLQALADAQAVRVPKVLAVGERAQSAFLALEWLDFGTASKNSEAMLGEQLAWQHRNQQQRCGWSRDNTIGSTPQHNDWCDDWVVFLRRHRLGFQLDLAAGNGAGARTIERGKLLCELLDAFFTSYRPVPSLLHGDLWGGNWAALRDGVPVIFDPAVYYGDREADLAMTRLFGGFGPAFYTAYQSTWPLDQAAGTRSTLYNLYHVLNHYNLFGGGYLAQAQAMIDRLLSELGH